MHWGKKGWQGKDKQTNKNKVMDLEGRKGSQVDMMEHTENDTRNRQKETGEAEISKNKSRQ